MFVIRSLRLEYASYPAPHKLEKDMDRELRNDRGVHPDQVVSVNIVPTATQKVYVYVSYKGHAREPGEE